MGGSPCGMSIIRNGNVALSILRKCHVTLSLLRKFKKVPCCKLLNPKKSCVPMSIFRGQDPLYSIHKSSCILTVVFEEFTFREFQEKVKLI